MFQFSGVSIIPHLGTSLELVTKKEEWELWANIFIIVSMEMKGQGRKNRFRMG
jgi:hypothetical protein